MKLRAWGQRGLAEQDLRQVGWLDSVLLTLVLCQLQAGAAPLAHCLPLWGPECVMNKTLGQDVLLFTSIFPLILITSQ